MEKIKKTARWMERAMNLLFLVCGLLTILFVVLNYYISLDKRHSGNTGYRSGRFPVWEGLGIYFCKAFLWNPSLYPDIRIRNSGGNPHRSSDWTAMCYFSGKDVPKES